MPLYTSILKFSQKIQVACTHYTDVDYYISSFNYYLFFKHADKTHTHMQANRLKYGFRIQGTLKRKNSSQSPF